MSDSEDEPLIQQNNKRQGTKNVHLNDDKDKDHDEDEDGPIIKSRRMINSKEIIQSISSPITFNNSTTISNSIKNTSTLSSLSSLSTSSSSSSTPVPTKVIQSKSKVKVKVKANTKTEKKDSSTKSTSKGTIKSSLPIKTQDKIKTSKVPSESKIQTTPSENKKSDKKTKKTKSTSLIVLDATTGEEEPIVMTEKLQQKANRLISEICRIESPGAGYFLYTQHIVANIMNMEIIPRGPDAVRKFFKVCYRSSGFTLQAVCKYIQELNPFITNDCAGFIKFGFNEKSIQRALEKITRDKKVRDKEISERRAIFQGDDYNIMSTLYFRHLKRIKQPISVTRSRYFDGQSKTEKYIVDVVQYHRITLIRPDKKHRDAWSYEWDPKQQMFYGLKIPNYHETIFKYWTKHIGTFLKKSQKQKRPSKQPGAPKNVGIWSIGDVIVDLIMSFFIPKDLALQLQSTIKKSTMIESD
jgi:hypothetical protein